MTGVVGSTGERRTEPLLRVRGLVHRFTVRRSGPARDRATVHAVNGVDLDLWPGETLALVGESGCGKSTTARALLRLIEPTAGEVVFDGRNVLAMDRVELRDFRRRVQIVFQDPAGALNPRMSAGQVLAEVLHVHGLHPSDPAKRVAQLLDRVGLDADVSGRYPHELSGGQRQRLGIARALAVEPEVIVLDEPVSALDVSVRAQVINLLLSLQRELGLTYLFIAHDLRLVERVSDRVAVMYLGRVVETAEAAALFENPVHPYTRALLASVPRWRGGKPPRKARALLSGEPPSPLAEPVGCPFHPRCPHPGRDAACTAGLPALEAVAPRRFVACIKASSDP